MNNEEWRPVVGYEGLYEVSDKGDVRSLSRTITRRDGRTLRVNGKILQPSASGNGRNYLHVHLAKDGMVEDAYIHRLVAMAFVDGYSEGMTVDHVNGDTFDNRAVNLEWCTQRENNKRAIDNGLAHPEKLTAHVKTDEFRAMMSDMKRKPVIRDDGAVYRSARAASEALGRSRGAVAQCIGNRCATVGGHTFRYLTQQEREMYQI